MSSESERLRHSWTANASAWRDAVRNREIESRRLVTDAAIVDAVLAQRPSRVLDAGCGEGWLARALAVHGVTVTGFDASAPLVEAARELGGGRFLQMTYEQIIADASALEPAFDTIVANFALLDDQVEGLLSALRALLAANGRLIVQTVHPRFAGIDDPVDGWRTETFAAFPGHWPEEMPWFFRTLESWKRLFATARFDLIETREPLHPERGTPASIVFIARPNGERESNASADAHST